MRKKNHNRKGILIDLTSLLDVIFIILLIVICNQKMVTERMSTQQIEAVQQMELADTQLQLYTAQMQMMNDTCRVSVIAKYEPENITKRHITILKSGGAFETKETFDMNGDNTKEALDNLEKSLKKYIDENSGKPIIFSLNEKGESILYRDEQSILKIFTALKDYSKDVYIK